MHQGDDHAARVRDAALEAVDAHVGAEERDIVSGGNHHPYVGMDRVEGKCRRHMDIAPYYHRDMTVR